MEPEYYELLIGEFVLSPGDRSFWQEGVSAAGNSTLTLQTFKYLP